MHSVNQPSRGNRYCGPAAISALTGITTTDAARLLRHVTGRRSITGVYCSDVIQALRLVGMTVYSVDSWNETPPTITQWRKRRPSGDLLVSVTGHLITVKGNRFWDNSHHHGAPLTSLPARKRVQSVFRVSGRVDIQAMPAAAPCARGPRQDAISRATDLGVALTVDCGGGLTSVALDPGNGRHLCATGNHCAEFDSIDYASVNDMWQDVLRDLSYGVETCDLSCDY